MDLLNEDKVFCHQLVIGELACGNIKNRFEIFSLLKSLPQTTNVSHDDILLFIEENKLTGLGLGYIDIHICSPWDSSQGEINRGFRPRSSAQFT